MRGPRFLIMAVMAAVAVVVFGSGVFAATDGYYVLEETTPWFDGTGADRLQAESTGYKFDYGDDARVTFTLPWGFSYYGQTYTQITADANGNIWFNPPNPASLPHSFSLATTGPVISAWNNDLNSYYVGGVFIRNKTDRVVVQWKTETFQDAGYGRVSDFEVVLFPNGIIRIDYKQIPSKATGDFGSGISKGDSVSSINLSTAFEAVTGLSGRSFLVRRDAPPPHFTVDPTPPLINADHVTMTGTRDAGSEIRVSVDSGATVGTVAYPTDTTWSCQIQNLPEAETNILVSAVSAAGGYASLPSLKLFADRVPPRIDPCCPPFHRQSPHSIVERHGRAGSRGQGCFRHR